MHPTFQDNKLTVVEDRGNPQSSDRWEMTVLDQTLYKTDRKYSLWVDIYGSFNKADRVVALIDELIQQRYNKVAP